MKILYGPMAPEPYYSIISADDDDTFEHIVLADSMNIGSANCLICNDTESANMIGLYGFIVSAD
jgi:hypothetical protein